MPTAPADPRAAAVSAALSQYSWQRFTPQMLARRAIAVVDEHELHGLLTTLLGGLAVTEQRVGPVAADDERVEPLVHALRGRHWRGQTVERVAKDLVAALDAWHADGARFDAELQRLLREA